MCLVNKVTCQNQVYRSLLLPPLLLLSEKRIRVENYSCGLAWTVCGQSGKELKPQTCMMISGRENWFHLLVDEWLSSGHCNSDKFMLISVAHWSLVMLHEQWTTCWTWTIDYVENSLLSSLCSDFLWKDLFVTVNDFADINSRREKNRSSNTICTKPFFEPVKLMIIRRNTRISISICTTPRWFSLVD